MNSTERDLAQINIAKRLGYTFIGLLAGDVILLFFLLQHSIHATLLAGESPRLIGDALQVFFVYAAFSLLGWLLIGLPTALIFPARRLVRLSWPFAPIVGACLGPIALAVTLVLFGHSHVYFDNLSETGTLFAYSSLVSSIAFVVYLALLHQELKSKPNLSRRLAHHQA